MTIARVDGDGDIPIHLASAVVSFNPVQQDVMLQFDAFGDKLSLWAWPVGQPMPTEPQVVAFDNTYAQGPVGLISSSAAGLPSDSTTYRFVHVADTHLTAPRLTGDYNQNGEVDAADYVVWRNGIGTTYATGDYDVWLANFGQTSGSGAAGYPLGASADPLSAAVSEPTTLLVLLAGALEAYRCQRKCRKTSVLLQLTHDRAATPPV
jgi:hypothetical protein